MLVLTGCSHAKSYPNQITLVIGNGAGDNHRVKKIAYPGESVKTNGDEQSWYLTAGSHNFVLTPAQDHGDRHTPAVAYTGSAGNNPRMQINVWLTTNWSLNQNSNVLKNFAVECGKYTCYDTEANQDHSSSPHSVGAGWFSMLTETFSPSIDRAVQAVAQNYPPTLWQDRSLWTKFSADVQVELMKQMRTNWASISNDDFFCANGETSRTKPCDPIQVIIDNIEPSNPAIKGITDQRNVLEQQGVNNALQIEQAKQKFGPDWYKVLGDIERINACNNNKSCSVVVGTTVGVK
jgi:hypothetical protein